MSVLGLRSVDVHHNLRTMPTFRLLRVALVPIPEGVFMAGKFVYLDDDVVRIRDPQTHKQTATLFWGDRVKLIGADNGRHVVELPRRTWDDQKRRYFWHTETGLIDGKATFRSGPVLKVRFIDVGQGDAAIVETPGGKRMVIDGGEGMHIRNYIGAAYAHLSRNGPLRFDGLVVTHGDADHFAGMTSLLKAKRGRGKPLIAAERVFHSGLVKGKGSGSKVFGKTRKRGRATYLTELHDDLRAVPDGKLNDTFQKHKSALADLRTANGKKPLVRRLEYGDDTAFDFLDDDIRMQVLGPITKDVSGVPALRYYRSAGHTINGHSVVLRMRYGNVRVLFGADLNEESEEWLLDRVMADNLSLESEILKVPHHGSHEFSPRVLEAIRPVVSVVSSGDENASKEYIHPRAGLMGALGRYSRAGVERPLIYVTEMVAFFARTGKADVYKYRTGARKPSTTKITHPNVYLKTIFGIVHVRTDGNRVLVATHSGRSDRKEAYAFTVAADGSIAMEEKPRLI